MQDSGAFNRESYDRLSIREKFEHIRVTIQSITTTLDPESDYIESINPSYLKELQIEIIECSKTFTAALGAFPAYELNEEDIKYIEENCKDTSRVSEEFRNAIKWLRVAHKALNTTNRGERDTEYFSTKLLGEYFDRLEDCRNSLIIILDNLKDTSNF